MFTYGIETLIRPQLNDPIVKGLSDFFIKLKKLNNKYYIKRTIDTGDFELSFLEINKEFDKLIYGRFNFHIEIKPYKTFAVLPIVNQDLKKTKPLSITGDIKKAMRQIKDFSKYIKDHEVIIDTKNARLLNLKDDWSITYFYDTNALNDLTPIDFPAITLHEIGHVFTLIEMYGNTTKQIVSLSQAFLSIDPMKTLGSKLAVSKKSKTPEKDISLLLYDKLDSTMLDNTLAVGRKNVGTDSEYEADDFVAKFGLSGDLTVALVKLIEVEKLGLSQLPKLIIYLTSLDIFLALLIVIMELDIPLLIIVVLIGFMIRLLYFIYNISHVTSDRNPGGDEHGDLLTRVKNLKLDIIAILRTTELNNKEKKHLLKQLDSIEDKTEIINKSIFNSVLGAMVNRILMPNLNIRDELASQLQSLINNEFYVKQARFGVGIENRLAAIKPNVYMYIVSLFSKWLTNMFKNADPSTFKKLNGLLEGYGLYLEPNNTGNDFKLNVRSLNDIDISGGVSTVAFTPKEKSDSIITLTLDSLKIKYMLANPLITIYDIQKIKFTNNKYLYMVNVERFTHMEDSAKIVHKKDRDIAYKLLRDIADLIDKSADDYGAISLIKELDLIFNSNIKNLNLIKPQLDIVYNIVKELPRDTTAFFDMYGTNIMFNKDGKLVVTDPIYYPSPLANKVSNDLDITKYE